MNLVSAHHSIELLYDSRVEINCIEVLILG